MRFRFSACVVLFLLATSLPATAQTAEEAKAFVDSAETVLDRLGERAARAAWVQATYITPDTKKMSARTSETLTAAASKFAAEAARFNDTEGVPYAVRRKLDFLRSGLTMPAPPDSQKTARLTERSVDLESAYAQGEWCPGEASSDRGPFAEDAGGWRTVSPPMQDDYTQFVELMNEGARSLGFSDVGAMWRSNYDMPPAEFADTMDRLWQQVRPLYVELHTYVRHRLAEQYGEDVVAPGEPIPAHLLGNMWAQSWTNIFPLVAPEDADPGYDLTERIREEDLSPEEMVEYGEGFFTSLGLDPLPETFWARSLFEKPADRQVVCHASAWDVDDQDDVRIKMWPPLFRGSANDGFHEALGDAVALSVTPQYLQQVGLIDEVPPPEKDIGLLLRSALDKVAFLPFGLMVDKWRWQVFSGEVAPAEYNEAWWDLREQYQGIAPPEERPEKAFDPGAKYHIPANTPYSRYFLARILQFQFHRSLCEEASPDGQLDGPLHRCSVYGSERAGDRLYEMMAMGKERPWPEALEALTGEREMDASAMLDYYAPLMDWLREQNDRLGAESGW
ncbi:MAG: peptidyl-dipeptidase [Bacteroidetes bacterium QH_9_67_14]|nr:MAG: peptidyl-dipeptidase [Bacteroidetes bacterium QH_9_67_14]